VEETFGEGRVEAEGDSGDLMDEEFGVVAVCWLLRDDVMTR
jgi:hypothetical protein